MDNTSNRTQGIKRHTLWRTSSTIVPAKGNNDAKLLLSLLQSPTNIINFKSHVQ